MDPDKQLGLLTEARNQFRWAIANVSVAAICVVLAAYQFLTGNLVAGFLIIAVSSLAVANARHHEKRGAKARKQAG